MNNNESNAPVITIGKAIPELFSKGSKSLEEMYPKTSMLTKFLSTMLILGAIGLGGYAFVAYALPIIGQVAGGVASAGLVIFAVAMAKPAWKFFTAVSDKLCKRIYRYNPDVFIEKQISSISNASRLYSEKCAVMKQVSAEMETQANEAEAEAEKLLQQLKKDNKEKQELSQQHSEKKAEVDRLKAEIDSGKLKTRKEREPYKQALRDLTSLEKRLATLTSNMTIHRKQMEADKARVEMFAAKSNIFERWIRFLDLGANMLENKRLELASWWETVQKDMKAAKAGKDATDALQFVLRDANGKSVDFDEACKAITNEINANYSRTVQNMADLQKFVDGFDMNSEDAWNELEQMLEQFDTGEEKIPMAAEITSPSHELTSSERQAAGMLGNIFDS